MTRRRFVYTRGGVPCEPYEANLDWTPPPHVELATGTCYDGLTATDGTDISSRSKHKEYMRTHGLTTADDYKGHWEAAAKERAAYFTEGRDPGRKEAIGRALYQLEKRGKR